MSILILHKCIVTGCPESAHKWEYRLPTLRELLYIQETAGLEPAEFGEGLASTATGFSSRGIRAMLAMIHLLHRRDGITVSFDDVDLDPECMELIPDPVPNEDEEPGKGTGTPTTPSLRPVGDEDATSTSGPENAAASEPSASPTPPTSGGTSD